MAAPAAPAARSPRPSPAGRPLARNRGSRGAGPGAPGPGTPRMSAARGPGRWWPGPRD